MFIRSFLQSKVKLTSERTSVHKGRYTLPDIYAGVYKMADKNKHEVGETEDGEIIDSGDEEMGKSVRLYFNLLLSQRYSIVMHIQSEICSKCSKA